MNLRRISSAIGVPEPVRLRGPQPSGSVAPSKTLSLLNRRQLQFTIQPIRQTPKPGTSTKGTGGSDAITTIRMSKPIQSKDHALPGPSRQLILSTPASGSDVFDGISELPPSAGTRSNLKENGVLPQKRIPSGLKSKVPSSKISRVKSTAKRRLTVSSNTHVNIRAPHQRRQAVAQLSLPASRLSGNSTDQFEADELAAAVPTPAPSRRQPLHTCQANCLDAFKEMKNVQQELVLSHKQILDRQAALIEKQNECIEKQTEVLCKLIQKQTEVLCKLSSFLDKNIEVFNKHFEQKDEFDDSKEYRTLRSKRCYGINNLSNSNVDDLNDSEKENGEVRPNEGQSQIGRKAASQYNDIRTEFGFLKLKTPKRDRDGQTVTPKTPKSILSRTLQMQLGDIYEDVQDCC